jgi:hypothetical protein
LQTISPEQYEQMLVTVTSKPHTNTQAPISNAQSNSVFNSPFPPSNAVFPPSNFLSSHSNVITPEQLKNQFQHLHHSFQSPPIAQPKVDPYAELRKQYNDLIEGLFSLYFLCLCVCVLCC